MTPQADWVKEFMPAWRKFLGYEQYLEKDFVEESGKQWLKAIKGIVKKEVALAQQRTEKKCEESYLRGVVSGLAQASKSGLCGEMSRIPGLTIKQVINIQEKKLSDLLK